VEVSKVDEETESDEKSPRKDAEDVLRLPAKLNTPVDEGDNVVVMEVVTSVMEVVVLSAACTPCIAASGATGGFEFGWKGPVLILVRGLPVNQNWTYLTVGFR
jgi:hypothetical protein